LSKIIALDSSIIIILAGGGTSVPDGKERMLEALEEHDEAGDVVCLPAAALAECAHVEESLWNRLRVLNLNAPAALLANTITPDLLAEGKKLGNSKVGPKKRELKVDAIILATAEVANADILYTTDEWFQKVAKKNKLRVDVREVPPLRVRQISLPNIADGEASNESTSAAASVDSSEPRNDSSSDL
jgi:predicted nucleic acid-binding protein